MYEKEPDGVKGITHNRTTWAHVWDDDIDKHRNWGDEWVYTVHDDDDTKAKMEVILCWDIDGMILLKPEIFDGYFHNVLFSPGLGVVGDRVEVDRNFARQVMINLGAAVYPSEENVRKYKKLAEVRVIALEDVSFITNPLCLF